MPVGWAMLCLPDDCYYRKSGTKNKSSWHEDYLQWICGFANAQGGRIYIGKNDAGTVVGLKDSKRLMEEIPNKIRNLMGITTEVNLFEMVG